MGNSKYRSEESMNLFYVLISHNAVMVNMGFETLVRVNEYTGVALFENKAQIA